MDKVERTNALKDVLEKFGYKLTIDEFTNLLEGELSIEKTNDIVNTLNERKVAVLGAAYDAPTMIGYGIMRLKNENGFYISYMKLKPGGSPEVRLIIENEQEFRSWFRCFVQDISKINK